MFNEGIKKNKFERLNFFRNRGIKNKLFRFITFIMSGICLFTSVFFSLPEASFVSHANTVSSTVRELVKVGAYAAGNAYGGNVGGILTQGVVGVALDFFTGSSSSGSDGNKYNYYINNGTTVNNNQTYNYKVFNDYSNNPIINNNQTYNYSFYNPITTEYNYTNNVYYNNDYSTYYYTVNNSVDNSVDYYVTDNTTNVSYYIINNETQEEWYYEIYYKLPDGRNSYNLSKDDIWGTYFIYNYDKYVSVAEDDGKTLGLWHMDGNLKDDSFWNNSSGTSYTASYVDGVYDGGKKLGTSSSDYITLNLDKVSLPASYTLEWLEYIPDSSVSSNTSNNRIRDKFDYVYEAIYSGGTLIAPARYNFYYSNDYTITNQNYSGVCGIDSNYWNIPKGGFIPMALVCSSGSYTLYANGNKISPDSDFVGGGISVSSDAITFKVENITAHDSGWGSYSDYRYVGIEHYTGYDNWIYERDAYRTIDKVFCNYNCVIDEVRLSKGALYGSNYVPSTQAFVANTVLVPPEHKSENKLAFKTNYDISGLRVGGVKPTYPSNGYVYVYLEDDKVKSIQQYQINGWYEIDASICKNDSWNDLKGTDLSFLKVSSPEEQKFTVTYKDGTSVFSERTYVAGTEVSALKCTNRHFNKEFRGWDSDISADEVVYTPGMKFTVSKDIKLYAVWEDISVDVELKYMDGSSVYKKETHKKGSEITIISCDNNYHNGTFKGWDVLKSANQVVYSVGKKITIDKDMSLYAVWEKSDDVVSPGLTLTYMDGDSVYKKELLESSGNVEISDCTNTHYNSVFKGWDLGSSADEAVFHPNDSFMVNNDTILYAVWERPSPDLTLTYMDSGLVYLKESYKAGENISLASCSNTHYNSDFKGWDIDSVSTDAIYRPGNSFQIMEDTVLYAVWVDSSSPDDSGGSDDTGDSDSSWDGIFSLIKKISGFIAGLFETILQGIADLLSGAMNMLESLTDCVSSFSAFLSGMFGFVPSEFWTAVTVGMTLIIIISIIRFFRG